MALTDWLNITRIVAVCILMAAVATWLLWQAKSRHGFAPLTAILRAAAQLAALVVILQFMITSVWWVLLWLAVMLVVAALTATRSIRFDRIVLRAVLLSILSGATVGVLVAFATGAVFAGASPVEAGLFQIVVLSTIMLSSAITAVLVTEQLGSPQQLPAPDGAVA